MPFLTLYNFLQPNILHRTVETEVNNFYAWKYVCIFFFFFFFCWTSNTWVWINLIKCSAGFEVCCCYGYSQCPTGFNFFSWYLAFRVGVGLPEGFYMPNPYILSTLGFRISLSQITSNTPFFASQWGLRDILWCSD